MKMGKLIALLFGVPLAIWVLGVYLATTNATEEPAITLLTRTVIDFWALAAVCVFVIWLIKKNQN
jgi:hypothetical protein